LGRIENTSSGLKRYVTFYFTNFPIQSSIFYLRKGFEVCGILEDVYVPRKRNKLGQPYGFVRFSNVRDITKLNKALNAVSFGDFRVRAQVARFDRNLEPLAETVRAGAGKFKGGVVPDCTQLQKQRASVGNGKAPVEVQPQHDTVAQAEGVPVPQEGVKVGSVLVRLGERRARVDGGNVRKQGEAVQVEEATDNEQDSRIFLRSYRSVSDDAAWAQRGVVATVANGDAVPVVRRRLQDAGFKELDILHLGGDRVLVRSPEGADVLKVFDQARDFFTLCFSHWVRWEKTVIPFQRGAWVRIYGIPLHAWNVNFFRLCVMDCGRFLRPDSYTVARDRLDYARVLISTSALAVVKKEEKLLVDGSLVEIQIIEEWGFDLGDDACLMEDDVESKVSLDADNESRGDPEASNQVDMLVDQIAKEVEDVNCIASQQQEDAMQPVRTSGTPQVARAGCRDQGSINTVLEPTVIGSASSGGGVDCVAETMMTTQKPDKPVEVHVTSNQRKRTVSCPPASRPALSGPWSLEWLRDHNLGDAGVIFSARKLLKRGDGVDKARHKREAGEPVKMKAGGFLKHSLFSLKRIARLPIDDRREVLQILRKNARKRRPRGVASRPSKTGSRESADVATSSSSVNNDWKHWVAMQGNATMVEEDVREVGKVVGATFRGTSTNMFSVLSKAGMGGATEERGG
jgi:hypothetical protein